VAPIACRNRAMQSALDGTMAVGTPRDIPSGAWQARRHPKAPRHSPLSSL